MYPEVQDFIKYRIDGDNFDKMSKVERRDKELVYISDD